MAAALSQASVVLATNTGGKSSCLLFFLPLPGKPRALQGTILLGYLLQAPGSSAKSPKPLPSGIPLASTVAQDVVEQRIWIWKGPC